MDKKPTHTDFGELKARFSSLNTEICSVLKQMRENLIVRNNGSPIVRLYAEPKSVDVTNCEIEELFAADFALKSNLNKKGE